MQRDGDNLLNYLRGILEQKGIDEDCINLIIEDIRLNYGGDAIYITKKDLTIKEKIRKEVEKTGNITKVAKKYRRSRGYVYNYLK